MVEKIPMRKSVALGMFPDLKTERGNDLDNATTFKVGEIDKDADFNSFVDLRFELPSLNPTTDPSGDDKFFIDTNHNAAVDGIPCNPGRNDLTLSTYAQGNGSGRLPDPNPTNQVIATPNPCWADYVGFLMIKKLMLKQSTNQVQTFTGRDLLYWHLKFHNLETREHYRQMTGGWDNGPLDPTGEVAKAQTWREFCVPLDLLFWVGKIDKQLPVVGTSRPLQIVIELEDPEYLYLTTKTNLSPVQIPLRNCYIENHMTHVLKNERAEILQQLDSRHGLTWKNLDIESQEDNNLTFQQNRTKGQIAINGLKSALTTLFMTKIHSLDKKTKYATYWTNFLRINSYEMKSGKDEIIFPTNHFYDQIRLSNLYNNSAISNYHIYVHNWSVIPDDKFNCWNHLEIGNAFNPVLFVEYAANHKIGTSYNQSTGSPVENDTNAHLFDIVALYHQFVQFKSGAIDKITS